MARIAYIAVQPLDLEGGKQIAPGEEVHDFEQWAPEAQHALLNLGWVRIEPAEDAPKPSPKPKTTAKKTTAKKSTAKKTTKAK